eukprot:09503.XXX_149571_149900_1 [CDS] Oithona nana genome sequencing.
MTKFPSCESSESSANVRVKSGVGFEEARWSGFSVSVLPKNVDIMLLVLDDNSGLSSKISFADSSVKLSSAVANDSLTPSFSLLLSLFASIMLLTILFITASDTAVASLI